MINPEQLRRFVIRPTLRHISAWSQDAEDLVLGTACVESGCGEYLRQLNDGPARGVFQMEPATHEDIWGNYLRYRQDLARRVNDLVPTWPRSSELLMVSLSYAAAMCRVHYLRVSDPIPSTLEAQAEYWKSEYNSHLGAGTPEKYIQAWRRYIG